MFPHLPAAAGQPAWRLDPRGIRTTYLYDQNGRPTARRSSVDPPVTFAYDALGNRVLVVDANGSTTTSYDARNAVTLVVNPAGHRLTYAYDALGARGSLLDPTGRQIDYQYDVGGRLNVLVNTPGSGPAQRSTWSYDPAGRLAENWLGNSTRASYTYDAAGRLATLRNLRPDDSVLSGYRYLLDATGNRVGVIEADGSRTTWTHDASYQLLTEHRTGAVGFRITHVYDPTGNRLVHVDNDARTSYAYDAANQLSTSDDTTGRTTYSYDASGNLAVQASPGGRTTNTWDAENRLTRVQLPGGLVNTMTYTPDGLRTAKEDTSGTTNFVWDNQNVLLETDAGNTVQAAYSLSPDLYGRLLDQDRSGVWRYYHFDGIDSTAGLSDTDGQLLDNYTYEAYGSTRSSAGNTVNPFRYVGGLGYYYDAALAQFYIRARHYSPLLARWISGDPIAFDAADVSLYRYVDNQPLIATDPSGLWDERIHKTATVAWAMQSANYPLNAARAIGDADLAVDSGGTGPLPGQDQSYHFDRTLGRGQDTRLEHARRHYREAMRLVLCPTDDFIEAARELGTALHPLQDWVAHGEHGNTNPGVIGEMHNSRSPQRDFGDPSGYPDDPLLDARRGPQGRPAGAAIITVMVNGQMALRDYAMYERGTQRMRLTGDVTIQWLKAFQDHVRKNGGTKSKSYFLK